MDEKLIVHIADEGTMDTVVEVVCPVCHAWIRMAYSQETAAPYRDPETGELDLDRFVREVIEPDYTPYCVEMNLPGCDWQPGNGA